MKVFVVNLSLSSIYLFGVFSTKLKAEKYLDKNNCSHWKDRAIFETKLNSPHWGRN